MLRGVWAAVVVGCCRPFLCPLSGVVFPPPGLSYAFFMFKVACLVACNRSRTWKHSCYVFRSKDVPSHLIIGDRAPLNQAHFLVKRSGEVLLGGTTISSKFPKNSHYCPKK